MGDYGAFNDKGLVEGGFHDYREAEVVADEYRRLGDRFIRPAEQCPDHPDQARDDCMACP